jgi:anti-sigma B factor antagonist
MDLRTDGAGPTTVVAVTGDVDLATAPRLHQHLSELVGQGCTRLAVDLRGTEFLDSSGLSALISGMKRARAAGGDLVLVCSPGRIRRLLEVVALDQVFSVYTDLDDLPALPEPI